MVMQSDAEMTSKHVVADKQPAPANSQTSAFPGKSDSLFLECLVDSQKF